MDSNHQAKTGALKAENEALRRALSAGERYMKSILAEQKAMDRTTRPFLIACVNWVRAVNRILGKK